MSTWIEFFNLILHSIQKWKNNEWYVVLIILENVIFENNKLVCLIIVITINHKHFYLMHVFSFSFFFCWMHTLWVLRFDSFCFRNWRGLPKKTLKAKSQVALLPAVPHLLQTWLEKGKVLFSQSPMPPLLMKKYLQESKATTQTLIASCLIHCQSQKHVLWVTMERLTCTGLIKSRGQYLL